MGKSTGERILLPLYLRNQSYISNLNPTTITISLSSLTPRTYAVHAGQAGVKLGLTVPRRLSSRRGTVRAVVARRRRPLVGHPLCALPFTVI